MLKLYRKSYHHIYRWRSSWNNIWLSTNGWIDQGLFDSWVCKHFLKFALLAWHLLVLLDGHSSHYCPDRVHLAAEEKVILFALPPNTTHLSHPLQIWCFGYQALWQEDVIISCLKILEKSLKGYVYSKLFFKAWVKAMSMHNIMSGFKRWYISFQQRSNEIPVQEPFEEMESLAQMSGLAYIPLFSSDGWSISDSISSTCSPCSRYKGEEELLATYVSNQEFQEHTSNEM